MEDKVKKHKELARSCRLEGRLGEAANHLRNAIRLLWEQSPNCKSFDTYFQNILALRTDDAYSKVEDAADILDSLGNVIRCDRIKPYEIATDDNTLRSKLQTKRKEFASLKATCDIHVLSNARMNRNNKDENMQESNEIDKEKQRDFKEAHKVIQLGHQLRKKNLSDALERLKVINESEPENLAEKERLELTVEDMKEKVARSLSSLAMLYKHLLEDAQKAESTHEEALKLFEEVSLMSTSSYEYNTECNREAEESDINGYEESHSPGKENHVNLDEINDRCGNFMDSQERSGHGVTVNTPNSANINMANAETTLNLVNIIDFDNEDEGGYLRDMQDSWNDFKLTRLRQRSRRSENENRGQDMDENTLSVLAAIASKIAKCGVKTSNDFTEGCKKLVNNGVKVNDIIQLGNCTKKMEKNIDHNDIHNKRCKLVLINRRTVPSDTGEKTLTKEDLENVGLINHQEQSNDSIPERIELNADEHDVVTIGRLAEDPTQVAHDNNNKGAIVNGKEDGRRNYKYVQLDSSAHEPIISRKHAQIKYRRIHRLIGSDNTSNEFLDFSEEDQSNEYEYAWVIRDLGSTNGILVNGVRVREYRLRNMDIVSFGGAATVELGSSVQTHKRKPVDSIFVYRFVCE